MNGRHHPMTRPRGTYGELARALQQAGQQEGTSRELCARAQVGFVAGRKVISRMRQRGDLVVVRADVWPVVLAGPERAAQLLRPAPRPADVMASLDELHRRVFGASR